MAKHDPLFKTFDVVQILTVKHVKFVSGPKNRPASPHGNWSVVGFIKSDLMLAKDSTIALVPIDSVRKVASYDLNGFLKKIKERDTNETKREQTKREQTKREGGTTENLRGIGHKSQ
jgi:hypothetical protein